MTHPSSCSSAKEATATLSRGVASSYDELLEEVRQLSAALSVYRHIVDRLTQRLASEEHTCGAN
jgi:hypothetical protein